MKELQESRKTKYTRMVLRDSLLELMENKPISKVTVKELCDKADINRTTFYAHFTDRNNLFETIEKDTLKWAEEMIDKLLAQTDRNETINILEKILQFFAENSRHFKVLMSEQGDIDFQKKLLTLIYKKCGIKVQNIKGESSVSGDLYFVFIVNGSIGLIQHWLKNGAKISAREMASAIYTMAFG